jgi:DNA-binding NtrC family response regulator
MQEPISTVLIVDDEPDMLAMLELVLRKKCGLEVATALSATSALETLQQTLISVAVIDIRMPDIDGLSLLGRIRAIDPDISVIIMTGYGTIDMAVQALKDGAYDFLEKPFEQDHIVRVVNKGAERTALLRANQQLQKQLAETSSPAGFIGKSEPLRRTLSLISRVADTDTTVLIRGESGTGKELAARALHSLSNRRARPMVTVNCPALPEHILESELFGFTRGAFTGAVKEKKGLFQEAHGSTILLDEIGDIAVPLQTKLLRVLQEKQIQPLGQNKTIGVNVRVVASTNQDLEQKMAAGEFREDLFYRLNVVTITMPNLAKMHEDVPLLIHHFFDHYRQRYNKENLSFSPEALNHLYRRAWPGNVRELRHTIKRVVLLSGPERIERGDLGEPGIDLHHREHPADDTAALYLQPYNEAKKAVVNRFTGTYITRLLERYHGNVSHAAAASGMQRQGLQRLMREHGIKSESFKKKSRSPR